MAASTASALLAKACTRGVDQLVLRLPRDTLNCGRHCVPICTAATIVSQAEELVSAQSHTAIRLNHSGILAAPSRPQQPARRGTTMNSIRNNVLAGLTTSFALVPECIAFALVAQLNPLMGLYGAFFICAITALFGGRPGMISGAAGSMAVVIVALVAQHGHAIDFAAAGVADVGQDLAA
eukprot:gene44067-54759_t